MNPKWKRLWSETPAPVSGAFVLLILIGLICLVTWSGLHHEKSPVRFIIAAGVGANFAYRVVTTGAFVLDGERTVTGRLAKALGAVGAVLMIEAGYLSAITIYHRFNGN